MRTGRKYENGVYAKFYRAVTMAEAEAEGRAVADILDAGRDGDPKLLVWWLQIKYPGRYGRTRDDVVDLKKELRELERAVGGLRERRREGERSAEK